MTRLRLTLPLLLGCLCLTTIPAPAQTAESHGSQLSLLTQKIDEQNTKIDALSQQILRLQQEVAQIRGASPANAAPSAATAETSSSAPTPRPTGLTHVVTRGETLTSIARQYKVSISDLQKLNHIDNDRTLQVDRTLVIPGSQSPSPTATPNE